MIDGFVEAMATGHAVKASGSLMMGLVAFNLMPWPPMALGRALMEPLGSGGAFAIGFQVLGSLLAMALAVCWLTAVGASAFG